jgi:hypothetical protein
MYFLNVTLHLSSRMGILADDRSPPFGLGRNRRDFVAVAWGRSAFGLDHGSAALGFLAILGIFSCCVCGGSLGFG